MELKYKGSFFRDLESISNKYVLQSLKEKILEIESAKASNQISRLKLFKARKRIWYKIELRPHFTKKIYWILCVITEGAIDFRRIKPESFFKKKF